MVPPERAKLPVLLLPMLPRASLRAKPVGIGVVGHWGCREHAEWGEIVPGPPTALLGAQRTHPLL